MIPSARSTDSAYRFGIALCRHRAFLHLGLAGTLTYGMIDHLPRMINVNAVKNPRAGAVDIRQATVDRAVPARATARAACRLRGVGATKLQSCRTVQNMP